MTQPPYEPDPDRPQDTTRSFPTYGRPDQPHDPQSATHMGGPGQPQPPAQPPYGQPWPTAVRSQPAAVRATRWAVAVRTAAGRAAAVRPTQGGQAATGRTGRRSIRRRTGSRRRRMGTATGIRGRRVARTGWRPRRWRPASAGIFFGFAAPVAIGLGIAALVQLKKRPEGGRGMAIAGLVIGSLTTLGYLILFGILIAIGASVDDDYGASGPSARARRRTSTTWPSASVSTTATKRTRRSAGPAPNPTTARSSRTSPSPTARTRATRASSKPPKSGCATDFAAYVGNTVDKSELDLAGGPPTKTSGTTRTAWSSAPPTAHPTKT